VQLFQSVDDAIAAVVVIIVMLAIAFPVHEFAHALAAYRLGDGTAKLFGRLTLDPRVHFDPVGGLLLVVSFIGSGGSFGFGWAKPTPVNPMNLEGGRRGEAIVAFAGPASNLVLAAAGAIPFRFILATGMDVPGWLAQILVTFVLINVALMIFNLIPIPPLDGSKVLYALMDPQTAWRVRPVLEQYGMLLLLVAVFFPLFNGNTLIGVVFEQVGFPLVRLMLGL
jgi:Zn-dependent protease